MINLVELFFALIVGLKNLGFNANDRLYIFVFIFGTLIVISKILKGNYSKKEIIMMLFLGGIGICNLIFGKSPTFLFSAIALCSLKNVDLKKLLLVLFKVKIFCLLFMIISSSLGIINNNAILFYRNGNFITRNSFGYSHPNEAQISFATTVFLALYLFYEKINILELFVICCLDYVMYKQTFSRTGFIIVLLCIILVAVSKYIFKSDIKRLKNFKYTYLFLLIITLLLSLLYSSNNYLLKLDSFLSGRLQYNNYLLKNYFPPVFGTSKFNNIVNIDNGYVSLLYNNGIIAFALISILYQKLINYLFKNNMIKEFLFILFFIFYSFTESFLPSISVNLSIILISMVIFKNGNVEVSL